MTEYLCGCGHTYPAFLGKYGCPNCEGEYQGTIISHGGYMKVLVCGGRDYDNQPRVYAVLDSLMALVPPITHLIHGGAKGADGLSDAD